MITLEDIGSVVTFDTYAPNILGAVQKRVTILGITDYTSVSTFQPDVKHTEIYGYLPIGSPKRYIDYSYLKVRDENGNIMYFGLPWIKQDTIVRHEGKDLVIRIRDFPLANIGQIRRMLISHNITNFEINDE